MSRSSLPVSQPPAPPKKTGLRQLRRATQLVCLALWIVLFFVTRAQVDSALPPDLFLVTDPLLAALAMGASSIAVPVMATSLLFVLLTLVVGRAFCGWVCPLGTLLDAVARVFGAPFDRFGFETHRRLQRIKYGLLALMVFGAIFSAQWVYLLDPLVLLFRGTAAGVYPALNAALPVSWFVGKTGMPHHAIAFAPLALLLAVLGLTAITPRFWCRYLCPLGAFYGLLSRTPLVRRRVHGCDACTGVGGKGAAKACAEGCRMGAVDKNAHRTHNHECIRCMTGRATCTNGAIQFEWGPPRGPQRHDVPIDLHRRSLVAFGASGIALAPAVALSTRPSDSSEGVVRPPRVLDEEVFVDQCVRCAMCVMACPTQTLQLTHLEAGVAGFWTPAITPSVGGCTPDCNACSVACPTEAIPAFTAAEADKWAVKMGTAVLEKGRCIGYSENSKCAECVDACPTKAFVVEPKRDGVPRRPIAVDYFRCVGCALCEKACANIVFGEPAIRTFSHGRGQPTTLRASPSASYETRTQIPRAVPSAK